MKTLKRTIHGENGELYYTKDGKRKVLAKCTPKIELYEKTKSVPILGNAVCPVKKRYIRLVICGDIGLFERTRRKSYSRHIVV